MQEKMEQGTGIKEKLASPCSLIPAPCQNFFFFISTSVTGPSRPESMSGQVEASNFLQNTSMKKNQIALGFLSQGVE